VNTHPLKCEGAVNDLPSYLLYN